MYHNLIRNIMAQSNLKVFLGGTCNGSTWRERLIPLLEVDYFDPIVDDWTPEDQKEEIKQRQICDFCLYVITPKMKGLYSIAEAVDDSNKQPEKTIFCTIFLDGVKFDQHQIKSLKAVGEMIVKNGGQYFTSLDECADYINEEERDRETV